MLLLRVMLLETPVKLPLLGKPPKLEELLPLPKLELLPLLGKLLLELLEKLLLEVLGKLLLEVLGKLPPLPKLLPLLVEVIGPVEESL